ncbi:tetratricopeptide (TPR) repeat protein [Crossiella equi]|uniref:Tetratricopeptide (TPR) repeat protein n=1 Tax=Crossiella equi TaxID=130796 RepID=A0ABS5AN01_9PSEU|nr:tetratricopeptide repeat protein [Crossiella equi]MBP2477920.1 tetratricopeptide (TPR) repeat protein [Crossiella equi]
MRLWWRRSRGVVFVVLAAVVVAAVSATAWLVFGDRVATAVTGLVTAVLGVLAARGAVLVGRRGDRRADLHGHAVGVDPAGRLPRTRDLSDPLRLGVHTAAEADGSRVPGYVRRDEQDRLDEAVRAGGFVLVVGESTAGKTRAAYESVRRLRPDDFFLAPLGTAPLRPVLETAAERQPCVLWLDDLERYLRPDGLTLAGISQLLARTPGVLVLATIRTPALEVYGARREASLDADRLGPWRTGREVLNLATEVRLPRRWSEAELARARVHTDPRLRAAAAKSGEFGVAELLADGPELVNDWHGAWRPGGHPRGAALVAAAVDCRRAGLHHPMPEHVLAALSEHYLAARGGAALRPEPLAQALSWASTPVRAVSSLLLPADGGYRAFDYLVDLPDNPPVPTEVWSALIDWAPPAQAAEIAPAARRVAQFDLAIRAYTKAAEAGIGDADISLAIEVDIQRDRPRARALLEQALARRADRPDDPETLRCRAALLRHEATDEAYTRLLSDATRVLGPHAPDTYRFRRQYASHLAMTGRHPEALTLFETLIADRTAEWGADHEETLALRQQLANWTGQSGNPARARELAENLLADRRRLLGPEHANVLSSRFQVAVWTALGGNAPEAIRQFETLVADSTRLLGHDHPHTRSARYRLAINTGNTGDPERAVALLADIVRAETELLGPRHENTLNGKYQLANYQAQAGDPAALQTVAEVVEGAEATLGPENPFTRKAVALRQRLARKQRS